MISEHTSSTFAAAITWIVAGLFFTVALVIAYVIPFHAQDALTLSILKLVSVPERPSVVASKLIPIFCPM